MDDKIVRNISEDSLNAVLSKLNSEFIKELPASPKELLKYATRRTDPVISENITYSLGQSMLSHRLSDEDYLMVFLQVIHTSFLNKKQSDKPEASILVSQTGAGKTNLRALILREKTNTIIINPDLYKKFNPQVEKILKEDPTHFGALTGIDSYDHASNIRNYAIKNNFDILFECAPSEKQGLIGIDLEQLNNANYNTQFFVLAVGDLISSLAIHYRYEHELENDINLGQTKLTDLKRHDDSYKGVIRVLRELSPENVNIFIRGPKQNPIPQKVTKHNKKNPLTVDDHINCLKKEREKSNYDYIFYNGNSNFQEDYNLINAYMEKRGAPEIQFQQLKEIYNRYITFLNYVKYKNENDICL